MSVVDAKLVAEQRQRELESRKVTFQCEDSFALGAVMNSVDAEGFVICPKHKLRRKGWCSLPVRLFKSIPLGSERIARRDHGFGMNYLAVERFILFGEKPNWMKAA